MSNDIWRIKVTSRLDPKVKKIGKKKFKSKKKALAYGKREVSRSAKKEAGLFSPIVSRGIKIEAIKTKK